MNTKLPETGYVRLSTILQIIPVGKTTWWNGVKAGRFPQPIKLGARITAWRAEDIHSCIARLGNTGARSLNNQSHKIQEGTNAK